MITNVPARSISRAVAERLPVSPASGLVLAVFERACLLMPSGSPKAPHREPVALVIPAIGDGPLNVVIDGQAGMFAGLETGTPITSARDCLRAGPLVIHLTAAHTWEPRPDWQALHAAWPQARCHLGPLRSAALQAAPAGSLLALFDGGAAWQPEHQGILLAARQAAEALAAGWAGDGQALVRGARHLAGLGGGLTPAGDDFLAGFMLRAWLAHPQPEALCHDVVTAAAPRTTTLAAAFLHAAARGECNAPWHALLHALASGEGESLTQAMEQVLAHGYTSGADTLAGFLWDTRNLIMSGAPSTPPLPTAADR
ncbi:MAG: DUF2877 domain-containing protein [Anaerolineae bacterium]|nr:DUF2877 domain-containing protein [Anaerolineae bacterium]